MSPFIAALLIGCMVSLATGLLVWRKKRSFPPSQLFSGMKLEKPIRMIRILTVWNQLSNAERQFYLALSLIGGVLAYLFFTRMLQSWLIPIPALATGVYLTNRIANIRDVKRKERFEEGNVRALRVMAGSLRTNPSAYLAFQQVLRSPYVPESVKREYEKAVQLMRAQVSLETSLKALSDRTDSPDLKYLSTILLIQQERGGDGVKALEAAISAILRRRQLQRRQKAVLSQIQAQVNIMSLMPFLFVGFLYTNNHRHFDPLIQTVRGKFLLFGAILMIFAGGEFIRRKIRNHPS